MERRGEERRGRGGRGGRERERISHILLENKKKPEIRKWNMDNRGGYREEREKSGKWHSYKKNLALETSRIAHPKILENNKNILKHNTF